MPVLGKEKHVHALVINSPYNIRGTVLTISPRMMPLDATPLALAILSVLGILSSSRQEESDLLW